MNIKIEPSLNSEANRIYCDDCHEMIAYDNLKVIKYNGKT